MHVTYCVTWIYFKSIPGSEVVHECVRVRPEMFLCRWVGVTLNYNKFVVCNLDPVLIREAI